jgi:hypothetical protein
MRRGVVMAVGGAILGLGVAVAGAAGERQLTDEELRAEMAKNRALARYVERNGMPDVAESRFLSDRPPWDDHEVALYYLDRKTEIAFARAFLLGRPEVHTERVERPLTDEQVASLAARARRREPSEAAEASVDRRLGPDERAEAAARRAEDAAGRVELAANAAENAAERAETVVGRMENAFHRHLRK